MTGVGSRSVAAPLELLAFVAPGIVHALGNSLFAVSGNAQFLGDPRQTPRRVRGVILEAVGQAEHAVDLLRCLSDTEHPERAPELAGVLLNRLAPILRVPLRDRQLGLEIRHSATEPPRFVEVRPFVTAVAEATRLLHESLPHFVDGALRIDLAAQHAEGVEVEFRVATESRLLPFPLHVDQVAAGLRSLVERISGAVRVDAGECLVLRLPTVN